MKDSVRRAAKCANYKLLTQKNIDDKTRKLVYAITSRCSQQDTWYLQVVFKQEDGWKIDKQTIAVENIFTKEPTHRARVVASGDLSKDKQKHAKKPPSPDAVFKAYKQAVAAGELDAHERFYTPALLAKTNKQLQDYNEQQITNLKRWNQKLMSCRDDKIVSETIKADIATIIYELTDTCQENKKSKKSYQRVIFKRESKSNSAGEHGWKIDSLTFSSKNDFNSDDLKYQFSIM